MNNWPNDKDDWSYDSASLLRGARRAHLDPTDRRARLQAVLARIQSGDAGASLSSGSKALAARAVNPAVLRQVAKVSLAVVGVAAVSIALMRANHRPSESARSTEPAPSAAELPAARVGVPSASAPTAPRYEPSEAPVVRAESQVNPRSKRRRPRANAGRQRLQGEVSSASPAAVVAVDGRVSGAPTAADAATHNGRSALQTSVNAAAAPHEASSKMSTTPVTPSEADVQESARPVARVADRPPTDDAGAELAVVKRMHAALRKADFSTALALSAEHERRWPHGIFELEREGVRAIASCSVRSKDATLRAKRFLKAHPQSPLAVRVSSKCDAQLARRATEE